MLNFIFGAKVLSALREQGSEGLDGALTSLVVAFATLGAYAATAVSAIQFIAKVL